MRCDDHCFDAQHQIVGFYWLSDESGRWQPVRLTEPRRIPAAHDENGDASQTRFRSQLLHELSAVRATRQTEVGDYGVRLDVDRVFESLTRVVCRCNPE